MTYVLPRDVIAPQNRMKLVDILIDGGTERSPAYALQQWDPDGYSIGYRWNGDAEKPNGTPNIMGNAAWIVLDKMLWPTVIANVSDPAKRSLAVKLLYGA